MAKSAGKLLSRDVSGSASPQGLLTTLTTTDATLLHQAPAEASRFDRIRIYAVNTDSVDRSVSVWWGGSIAPAAQIPMTIPSGAGAVLMIEDWPIERGLPIYAQAVTANTINIATLVTPIRSI